MKPLRFEFRVMTEDGECVVADYTHFTPDSIDQFGACEMVDMHTGSALRFVRRAAEKASIVDLREAV